jgi:excinuclease ABC subunit A
LSGVFVPFFVRRFIGQREFMDEIKCPVCEGSRLKKKQFFKINEKKHYRVLCMDISDLTAWFLNLDNQFI